MPRIHKLSSPCLMMTANNAKTTTTSTMRALLLLLVCGGVAVLAGPSAPTAERLVAAATGISAINAASEHLAEDDSDMLMEPNDFQPRVDEPAAVASRHEYYPIVDDTDDDEDDGEFRPALRDTSAEYEHHQQQQRHRPQPPPQRSVLRHQRKPTAYDITTPSAQSFLPSFFRDTVPPLGHSRPYYAPPQLPSAALAAHNGGGGNGGGNNIGIRSVAASIAPPPPPAYDQTLLGSGDFGVIRGGTFYQENDPPVRTLESSNDYYSFYKNNGHGRPQAAAFTGGVAQHHQGGGGGPFGGYGGGEEQFSNFRDFADINAPSDPAYSQFVVVYANKNATTARPMMDVERQTMGAEAVEALKPRRPQNIFEQLEALDREQPERYEVRESKPLKPSSFKAKLAKTKLQKKYTKKAAFGPKDHDYEPLMALS